MIVGRPGGELPMKQSLLFSAVLLAATISTGSSQNGPSGKPAPQFTKDNELLRPTDYRDWIYLSSGFVMTYGPTTAEMEPSFDNVFVHPVAYRAFLESGKWPDNTI